MIVDPAVEAYAAERTTAPPAHLDALAEETRRTLTAPQMLTGRLEGRFLETLVWFAQPRRVLEIGTYSGYSALAMAAGLPEGGSIVTCEVDPRHAEVARRHVAASPYADRVEVREGPALETVTELPGPWDLVFVDADKTGYPDYVDAVLPKLGPRGLLVLDNTLRDGLVLDPPADDPGTQAIAALNDRLARDPALVVTLLTVRDGVTLVRRA